MGSDNRKIYELVPFENLNARIFGPQQSTSAPAAASTSSIKTSANNNNKQLLFQGWVAQRKPYNAHTTILTLTLQETPPSGPNALKSGAAKTIQVRFKGAWAKELDNKIPLAQRPKIAFFLDHGKVSFERKQSKEAEKMNSSVWQEQIVVFKSGVQGWHQEATALLSQATSTQDDRDEDEDKFEVGEKVLFEFMPDAKAGKKASSTSTSASASNSTYANALFFDEPMSSLETDHPSGSKSVKPSQGSTYSEDADEIVPTPPTPPKSTSPAVSGSGGNKQASKRPRDEKREQDQGTKKKLQKQVNKPEKRQERKSWGLLASHSKTSTYKYKTVLEISNLETKGSHSDLATIVLVRDENEIKPPGGKAADFRTTFRVTDPSMEDEKEDKLEVTIWAASDSDLPKCKRGDVILLRVFNRGPREVKNDQIIGYKNKALYKVFSPSELSSVQPFITTARLTPPKASFSQLEIDYAKDLVSWWKRAGKDKEEEEELQHDDGRGQPTGKELSARYTGRGPRGRSLVQLKDVVDRQFVDVVAVIVKKWSRHRSDSSQPATIVVTDYTENDMFFDYNPSTAQDWKGPEGQLSMQVNCWGANADEVDKLHYNSLVHLRNLRPAFDSNNAFLEGHLDVDHKHPTRPDIRGLKESEYPEAVKQLQKRKKEYERQFTNDHSIVHSGYVSDSKMKKVEFLQEAQTATVIKRAKDDVTSSMDVDTPNKPYPAASIPTPLTRVAAAQKFVKCSLATKNPDSIGFMKTQEVENVYRLHGKVMDYSPNRLDEWIQAWCPTCLKPIDRVFIVCPDHDQVELGYFFHLRITERPSSANLDKSTNIYKPAAVWITVTRQCKVLSDLPPTAGMRQLEEDSELQRLRNLMQPILGNIEQAKRQKRNIVEADHGEYFDFAARWGLDNSGKWSCHFVETNFVGRPQE